MRPVIGITCNYTYDGSGPFAEGIGAREQEWQLLADDYVAAVTAAGGLPLCFRTRQWRWRPWSMWTG